MEEITGLITNVGFPIVLILTGGKWIKTYMDKQREDNKEREDKLLNIITEFKKSIDNNTQVINEMKSKLL